MIETFQRCWPKSGFGSSFDSSETDKDEQNGLNGKVALGDDRKSLPSVKWLIGIIVEVSYIIHGISNVTSVYIFFTPKFKICPLSEHHVVSPNTILK